MAAPTDASNYTNTSYEASDSVKAVSSRFACCDSAARAASEASESLKQQPWRQVVGRLLALQVLTLVGYHFWAVPPGPPWNPRTVMFGPEYTVQLGDDVDVADVVYFYMEETDDADCADVFSHTTVRFNAPDSNRWEEIPLIGDCTLSTSWTGRREFSGVRRVGLFQELREGSYEVESSEPVYWLQQSEWDTQHAITTRNYWITIGFVLLLPFLVELYYYCWYLPRQGEAEEKDIEMALATELRDPSAWKDDLPEAWKQAAGSAPAAAPAGDNASHRSPRSAMSGAESTASPRGFIGDEWRHTGQSRKSTKEPKEVSPRERGVTTWMYKPDNKKNIAPRSTPDLAGTQTRQVVHPGDLIRVVEERKGKNGIVFLKLEGEKGWLFDQKPGLGVMCVKQEELPARSPIPPKSKSGRSLSGVSRKSLSTANTGLGQPRASLT